MTNFEKWKEGLTAEKLVEMLRSDWDTANAEEFLAWANAEAGESADETDPNQTDLFDGESK